MLKRLLSFFARNIAMKSNRLVGLYRKVCKPDGKEWAQYLRKHGQFYAMGEDCLIEVGASFTDPAYVRLGNNVHLSGCKLIGHDGSIAMLGRRYGVKLDRTGKIDIRDNVFIGEGAIILPGVTIGPDAIVAAGAVVASNVPENSVVGGVPAKLIIQTSALVEKWREETIVLPWAEIIARREGAFDPVIEPKLIRMRVNYFYNKNSDS